MRRSLLAAASLAALFAATPAAAQATVTGNLALNSAYFWRGITFSNRSVVQGDVSLAVPVLGGSLAGGAWANYEPGTYAYPRDISMNAADGPDITEVDLWAEYGYDFGATTLAAGVLAFRFPNENGFTDDLNTTELYGRLSVEGPLSPSLTIYRDVDKVIGTYAEGSVSQSVNVFEWTTVTLGALAGASWGHTPEGFDNANFARDGLTHVDLSVSVPLTSGRAAITPTAHVVLGSDPVTRITEPDKESGVKAWVGVRVTWGAMLSRPAD
ncbi:TorF family putative porin [Longimicrobium sp.]|jgi:uncharacterized protein (TIGR02001 family)|uniref:TorF family putative porin n=1 Tax=Longimicrobium sp. TaxID=2029185 RepID=UPI002EDB71EB